MIGKGVGWSKGRVFHRDSEIYEFDLLAKTGHSRPAFIDLQQYYVEGLLYERARALPNLEMRWKHRVADVHETPDGVGLDVDAPDGGYSLHGRYLVAADGARSFVRKAMGLGSRGDTTQIGDDRFTAFRMGASKSRANFLSTLRAGKMFRRQTAAQAEDKSKYIIL